MQRPEFVMYLAHFCYGGVHPKNVATVLRVQHAATQAGVGVIYNQQDGALIEYLRSWSLSSMLREEGAPDVCVMIDHDMEVADPRDVVALAIKAVQERCILGTVASRRVFGNGVCCKLLGPDGGPPGNIRVGEDRILDAEHTGTGIIAIPRVCVERIVAHAEQEQDVMWKARPCRVVVDGKPSEFIDLFRCVTVPARDGQGHEFLGEDVSFIRRAQRAGVRTACWLKPYVTHHGTYGYTPEDSIRRDVLVGLPRDLLEAAAKKGLSMSDLQDLVVEKARAAL